MQRTHMCRLHASLVLRAPQEDDVCVSLLGEPVFRSLAGDLAWQILPRTSRQQALPPHAARCVCRFTPLYASVKSREVVGGAESKKTKAVLSFTCTRPPPMKANPDILLKQPYLLERRPGPASSSGRQRTASQTPLCPAPPLRLMIAAAVAAASAVASRKHL